MLKKISFALILGILCMLFFAQYDSWTHKKIVQLIQRISHDYLGGTFSCTVQTVNFFAPSLVLHDVEMKSGNSDDWVWRCKKCEVHCSWFQLLLKGVMDQYIVIDGFECNSRIEASHLMIELHMLSMLQKSFLPFAVELKSLLFKDAHFYAYDNDYNSEIVVSFNSSSLRVGQQLRTTMSITDGQILYEKNKYSENIVTDFFITTEYVNDVYDIAAQIAGTFVLSHLGNQGSCYITGGWKSDRGRFSIRNAYNAVMIDPIIITEREVRVNARFPLSYATQCFTNTLNDQIINGTAHCSIKISRDDLHTIDGQLIMEDVKINENHLCDTGKIIFARDSDDWKIRVGISRYHQECKGTGYWHQSAQKGELTIKNNTELSVKTFPYWRIKPNAFCVQATVDKGIFTGNYEAIVTNTLTDATHKSNALFSYKDNLLYAHGLIDDNQFSVSAALSPHIILHHCLYKDKDNKQLITLQTTENNNHITGSISFPFIRSLINNTLKYDVQGEGKLDISAIFSPTEIIADLALNDTTIRLPQTYNFIDGLQAHCIYTLAQRSIVLENINLSLYTGKMNCLRATAYFDNQGNLTFAHAPFVLDGCLLNIKKDLFAIVSGNLLFSKRAPESLRVEGNIFIDKAQLKENLFSGVIQKQLLSYTHSAFSVPDVPLIGNVTIETKSPIVVDTGFLQTDAHVNVQVKKDAQEPRVTGTIALHSGILNFPYKPLYISKGVITFTSDQLFDPLIELVARNKIKKYDIALQVDGSLQTHHIALDATPPLSEEQIVGLLLVGTEEQSLNSMMPALIVQNLKNLIFSHNQSSFFDKYFKPLLGSFNINLVPSFIDQTGRGGLRGALEITLDDRWRAVIQKNFSLTEDTKFELEFLLSDDITLRAIRDERRDLGGEVEMRWKF